jgi:integrase
MVAKRRLRGEGSLYQRHFTTCPKADKKGDRAKHTCDGLWIGTIDLGWRNGKRVRKTVSGKTLKIAQEKFKILKSELDKGVGFSKAMSVEEWLNHWLDTIAIEAVRESTLETYRQQCRTWLIPYLGRYRLDRLNEDHIRALIRTMKEAGKAEATRKKVYAVLRRALVVAERERRIARNPAEKMEGPGNFVVHRTPLTLEQAKQVLAHLDGDPLAARWVAALLLGMRQGECLGLKWSNVDYIEGLIHIRTQLSRSKTKGLTDAPLKSVNSFRSIPILPLMSYALQHTKNRGEYVFYGEAIDRRVDWSNWKQLMIDSGVVAADAAMTEIPELAAARTTAATLLRDAGVPDTVVRDILGHSQVQVTQESYMRTDARTLKEAMKALESSVENN